MGKWSDYDEETTIADGDDILFRDISDTTLSSTGTQKRIKKSNLTGDFGSITSGKMIKADANGLPVEATNTDADVADAVTKKHTQNTDTGTSAAEFYVDTGGANVAVKRHIQDTSNPHSVTMTQIGGIVTDTTPQLGGDLDLNTHAIDFPTTPNIADCLDEDDMASNSATAVATQQSIKAYVDNNTKWRIVSDVNVAADSDYVDFTGLDINTDGGYRLEMTFYNASANSTTYSMYINADYTDTDYYNQFITANGTTVSASNGNNAGLIGVGSGVSGVLSLDIFRGPSGYARAKSERTKDVGANMTIGVASWGTTATVTNITSIRISSDQTGGIGAGSRLTLFKKRG